MSEETFVLCAIGALLLVPMALIALILYFVLMG